MKKAKKSTKILLLILITPIFLFILVRGWPFVPSDEPWLERYDGMGFSMRFTSDRIPVEEQRTILADLNYTINPEVSEIYYEWLHTDGWDDSILERYPFWLLFTSLGREITDENGQVIYFSDSTYCLEKYPESPQPAESIYVLMFEQINRISGGELNIDNVDVKYSSLGGRIILSYELNGEPYKWSIKGSRDYNPNILKEISECSKNDMHDKNLYWQDDEQGIHIVYRTDDEIKQLYEVTGINFLGADSSQLVIP